MEAKITITQPYCVTWLEKNRNKDGEVVNWIKENVKGRFELLVIGSAKKVDISDYPESNKVSDFSYGTSLFLFECPRDALLFKLTWGGR